MTESTIYTMLKEYSIPTPKFVSFGLDELPNVDFFPVGDDADRSDESSDFLFHLCYMYESNGIFTAAYP